MKRHITINCKKQQIRNDDPGFSISSVKLEYPVENIKLRTKRKPDYKYQSDENETTNMQPIAFKKRKIT